ncbi:CoA transferase [Alcaligenaceae bacterium CGII-47]|nr:CoA transferase [Alcaligenaceae bacterium CGII-47]
MFDRNFIDSLPAHDTSKSDDAPLNGILVLDLTHYLAGPLASMLLADMGATVIKIESPGGDRFRSYPPHDESAPEEGAAYLWANRNKLGIELDLKHPAGKKALWDLVRKADVLIENFATGVMDRLNFGYEAVAAAQPSLVYCSVSAYGRKGAFASRPGFDSVVQAESGFVSMNGYADRDGVRSASSVMDIGTALLASNGILAALNQRHTTGKGRHVEVSLYGSALLMAGYGGLQTLCRGTSAGRFGNTSPDSCPTGVFQCADSSFFLHCGNTEIFVRLMRDVVQREDVALSAQYQSARGRLDNKDVLFKILQEHFSRYAWHELNAKLAAAKVPAGEVRDMKAALLSEETASLGLVGKIPHPTLGWVPNIQTPILFDGVPSVASKAAPLRGEDSKRVLTDLVGYSESEMNEALHSGAFYIRNDL